jgi:hypothetical protein
MHKYAALTALAIALITMLALAVSASMTPGNAYPYAGDRSSSAMARELIPSPRSANRSAKPNCGTPPTCGTAPGTMRGVVLLRYRPA